MNNNTNTQGLQGKAAWIARLKAGETVSFRESGNSMHPRIKHRQKCTYAPITSPDDVKVGDYVFCKVGPWTLTHMITAIKGDPQNGFLYQISNNHGHVNGWTGLDKLYGKVIAIED